MIELAESIAEWLPHQRWFASKHRVVESVTVLQRAVLAHDDELRAEHVVVEVKTDDGATAKYQVPIGYRTRVPDPLAEAVLPGMPTAYDGLRDPAITACYLTWMGLPLTLADEPSRMLSVEQSNTSVVFGERLLVKFFRQLEPGVNPDIELLDALTDAGCEHIAPLEGWLDGELAGESTALAMASAFIPNAADGWTMALTSVRDLFSEADLRADEVGGDFAGEAHRLGEAVAAVHAALAEALGTWEVDVADTVVPVMRANLVTALTVVPELGEFHDDILAVYDAAMDVTTTVVQRIHGDLHLGQVLRSPQRWLLVDFEGEPLRPLSERRAPDSVQRDVAGMLRSFDYAGHQAIGDPHLPNAAQRRFRAAEWVHRNTQAFLAGYGGVTEAPLLTAYQLDKAVYEAVYEARHRPDWMHLPLRAISELVAEPH